MCVMDRGWLMRKKRYTPKPINVNAYLIGVMGVQKLGAGDVEEFTRPVREAVDAIALGQGTKDHWQAIFSALNMLEQFSRMPKIMRGASDYIDTMQSVIVAILDRQKRDGSRAVYPSERADLESLRDLWADVLGTVSIGEYDKASTECERRLRAILSSKTRGVAVVAIPE